MIKVGLLATVLISSTSFASQLPNPTITPGATRTADVKYICTPGTSKKDRLVTESEKRRAYSQYGVPGNHQGICSGPEGCEVDHLISLQLGGSNDIRNLWPQPYDGDWNAHHKDVLENKLHKLVCSGQLTLEDAQHAIASDWIKAYKQYVSPTMKDPRK